MIENLSDMAVSGPAREDANAKEANRIAGPGGVRDLNRWFFCGLARVGISSDNFCCRVQRPRLIRPCSEAAAALDVAPAESGCLRHAHRGRGPG